ncbi:MAG: DUF899 domain-containing protein, partial [Actinomycetota bacterium]|nr:DUF899 domain-containing protein [Actinomycetota bacterium]
MPHEGTCAYPGRDPGPTTGSHGSQLDRQPRRRTRVKLPEVVAEAEWREALEHVREQEKRLTREHDALAAQRRR